MLVRKVGRYEYVSKLCYRHVSAFVKSVVASVGIPLSHCTVTKANVAKIGSLLSTWLFKCDLRHN